MDKKPEYKPDYVKEDRSALFYVLLLVILILILLSCDSTQDAEQIPNIKGTWYSEVINTPMGGGFAETKIQLYNTTYLFSSNTIFGQVNQQGSYNYDGEKIRLELSFPSEPFSIVGKSGSVWLVTLDEHKESMLWENTQNDYSIIWEKSLTGF
jgi:hypothetical protein